MIPLPFTLLFWVRVYTPFLCFLSREYPLAFVGERENGCKNSKDISGTFSGVGSVGSLPRWFPLFSFFCLLVSSVSDFHPDTRGAVVDTFFCGGCCKQITLACACSVSAMLGLPLLTAHTAQALRCSTGKRLRLALGCMHLPGLNHSGSAFR